MGSPHSLPYLPTIPHCPGCWIAREESVARSPHLRPLAHASDGVLFCSLRSSSVRLAAMLTTIFTPMLAYFARSNWQSQLEHSDGRCSRREGSARTSQQPLEPQPAVLRWR